jgi:hypothetical protein
MAAISLKCLLAGSQSSHQPPRIGRERNVPTVRAMLQTGRISGCLKIGVKIAYLFPNKHKFVHVFTNAGKAIILENLNFCKTKFENELKLRILFKYCLDISLFAF